MVSPSVSNTFENNGWLLAATAQVILSDGSIAAFPFLGFCEKAVSEVIRGEYVSVMAGSVRNQLPPEYIDSPRLPSDSLILGWKTSHSELAPNFEVVICLTDRKGFPLLASDMNNVNGGEQAVGFR